MTKTFDRDGFSARARTILHRAISAEVPVAGVVAAVTDRAGTIYAGAVGKRALGGDHDMTTDTMFQIASTGKAITATAALQLVEAGDLDLDAPAKEYAPALGDLQVLDGFDGDGQPHLRPPASQVTTRQLLTHSAGFGYDFFNVDYRRLVKEHGQLSVNTASLPALMTPLLFDPGTRWEYGSSIDWVGQVIEGISGRRLGQFLSERVFAPCGMTNTTFAMDDEQRSRMAKIHFRGPDGSLTPTDLELPQPPEVDFGGHALYGTVDDYLKFIRMWLNDGRADLGQVLRPETVQMAVQRHLGQDLTVTALSSVDPMITNDWEFSPGLEKSWSLAFMRNEEPAPTGRPAGASGWAGLMNLYYWIDRANGLGGYWATQILPFGDPVSYAAYLEFETAAYDALRD